MEGPVVPVDNSGENKQLLEKKMKENVLDAISTQIHSIKPDPTPSDYFSALMNALTTLANSEDMEQEDMEGKAEALLRLCIDFSKRVSPSMRSVFLPVTLRVFPLLVKRFMSNEGILWHSLKILAGVALASISIAGNSKKTLNVKAIAQSERMIMFFCLHNGSRVRNLAARSISSMVAKIYEYERFLETGNELCSNTLDFALRAIKRNGQITEKLATLDLLGQIFPLLSDSPSIRELVSVTITSISEGRFLSTTEVKIAMYRAFSRLRGAYASASIDKLIQVGKEFKDGDPVATSEFFLMCLKLVAAMSLDDRVASARRLDAIFNDMLDFIGSKTSLLSKSRDLLKIELLQCISSVFLSDGESKADFKGRSSVLESIGTVILGSFTLLSKANWDVLLAILNGYLAINDDKAMHYESLKIFSRIVSSSGPIRSSARNEIKTSMKIFRSLLVDQGIEKLLDRYPLVDAKSPFPTLAEEREWMITEIKISSCHIPLRYFWEGIKPIADNQQRMAEESEGNVKFHLEFLQSELFSLFVTTCKNVPKDFVQVFPDIFDEIAETMEENEERGRSICDGLVDLINIFKREDAAQSFEREISEISSISQKFLGILLKAYEEYSQSSKPSLSRLIGLLLSVSRKRVANALFKSCLTRFLTLNTRQHEEKQHGETGTAESAAEVQSHLVDMLDIIYILIPFIESAEDKHIMVLYRSIRQFIAAKSKNKALTKRSYKILSNMLLIHTRWRQKVENEVLAAFFPENSAPDTIYLAISGRRHFLDILRLFSNELSAAQVDCALFVGISSMNDHSVKTRKAGLLLLTKLAENASIGNLDGLLVRCSAGIGGINAKMISASVISLYRLIKEHHMAISADLLQSLTITIIVLVGGVNAEVARSALKYMKAIVKISTEETLLAYLPVLMGEIAKQIEEDRGKGRRIGELRSEIKVLLDRICGKIGYSAVLEAAADAPTLRKMILNIKSEKKRAKAKEKVEEKGDEEVLEEEEMVEEVRDEDWDLIDSDEDDGFRVVSTEPILSGDIDAPTDFLDSSAAGRGGVIQRKVFEKAKIDGNDVFFDDEGKIVVEEDTEMASGEISGAIHGKSRKRGYSSVAARSKARDAQNDRHERNGRVKNTKKRKKRGDAVNESMQPYAYIPLTKKNFGKRSKGKVFDQYTKTKK